MKDISMRLILLLKETSVLNCEEVKDVIFLQSLIFCWENKQIIF
jgi:hypothetical protein